MHGRDRRFVTSRLRDRVMLAVVTARNTPGTFNNSAECPFNHGDMDNLRRLRKMEDTRDVDFVGFEIWVPVLSALLLVSK